ncbi:PP2C family protein-serine/threonine phosphatase [Cylindrospermopsis raciborskii]|uniref:PP2C family protein-serine/threonine phosphatase n=1 Tax=Cylindrospermopsis raciborskii TaxID=77022 RepID=UPI000E1EB8E3|nr:SpoIIE family protein phosphatase [Cylindrospermopsis raciborskii]UJL34766.1 SpoIIE family protein phosphatase [Cylindrospermopsis raciborskii Cr2010]UJS04281.1 SpoIIE family protein phosphatase [Cylindrospermopsis raciborskii KLL07]
MFQILVIDDDSSIQILLKRILEKQHYQVITTSNGREGILQAVASPPALIICDWMMPELSGLEVCNFIKNHPNLSSTFFILLTSLDSVSDRVKGLDSGADDFISKPIEQNELQARVRAGLRLHQLNRDLQTQKLLLETELSEATDYVKSLLPLPINQPVNIDYMFLPSRKLGGDCFDYYWLDGDHLAIYLLDAVGHGLRATLPAISVLNLLRSRALKGVNYYQPSQVLSALNDAFQTDDKTEKYFTIWYGVYNHVNRQLTYASAGHPPAVLLSPKSLNVDITLLKTPGMPIGMFCQAKYVDEICQIGELSSLYIFSDGAYEITNFDGILWSLEEFIQLLVRSHNLPKSQLEYVIKYLVSLNSKEIFDDDLAIIQIKFD